MSCAQAFAGAFVREREDVGADRDVVVVVEDAVRASADHARAAGCRRTRRSACGSSFAESPLVRGAGRTGSRRCWPATRSLMRSAISVADHPHLDRVGLARGVGDVPVIDVGWGRRGRRRRSPWSRAQSAEAASRPKGAWVCRPDEVDPNSRITSTDLGPHLRARGVASRADSPRQSRCVQSRRRTPGPIASAPRCGCTANSTYFIGTSRSLRRRRPACRRTRRAARPSATSRATASAS